MKKKIILSINTFVLFVLFTTTTLAQQASAEDGVATSLSENLPIIALALVAITIPVVLIVMFILKKMKEKRD